MQVQKEYPEVKQLRDVTPAQLDALKDTLEEVQSQSLRLTLCPVSLGWNRCIHNHVDSICVHLCPLSALSSMSTAAA